jgi:hypothetical protein
MKLSDLQLAAKMLHLDLRQLTPSNYQSILKSAQQHALKRCQSLEELNVTSASYELLNNHFGGHTTEASSASPSMDRSDPQYKVDMSQHMARFDPVVFNALFEASKPSMAASTTGKIQGLESCPHLTQASVRIKEKKQSGQDCYMTLKNKVQSNNRHFALREFEREANTSQIKTNLPSHQIESFKQARTQGMRPMADSELRQKASTLRSQYDNYVQTTCSRDQPVFSRSLR